MTERDWLAERFESHRSHLRGVAYRLLGSRSEADDAVQEAWLRLSRSQNDEIDNLGGWLTTVVGRISLDMLRSRTTRREDVFDAEDRESIAESDATIDPQAEAELADSVGLALLVVLEALSPSERLAFVLHDLFDVPFDEIAPIVGRTPAASRQLASRARRRVRGADPDGPPMPADVIRRQAIVDAFFSAARGGDFEALLTMLDPEVVLRADAVTVAMGAEPETVGSSAVVKFFEGKAHAAESAFVNGAPGAVWAVRDAIRVAFEFIFDGERIVGINLIGDQERITAAGFVV